jgi:hypothetical protein
MPWSSPTIRRRGSAWKKGAISHAAQHLTHVKAEASLADVVLRGIAEEVNVLRARRDTAAAALHEVQTRRMNGATDDGDAETVSLLALDAEGLGALLAEAESRHRLATEPATAARQMVAKAAAELAQAEETAVMRALVLEADAIAAALLEVVDRIEELRARTGHARPLWNVTLPLYRLARRSAAAFGHL